MKKIILALVCMSPLAGIAQGGYTLTGKFSEINVPAKAYLVTVQNRNWKETDSTIIKGGKFRFTGKIREPQEAIVVIKRSSGRQPDVLNFVLENSNITFTGKDSIRRAVISGSISNKENRELRALVDPLTTKITALQEKFPENHEAVSSKAAEELKIASDSINSYVKQIRKINLTFIESHPNSYIALRTFNDFILIGRFNPAEVSPLYYKFSPRLQSSPLGKLVFDRIIATEKRGLGQKIIDFTQTDLSGKTFNITSLRGKYVFLDFWASWCYWCRAENPNVAKAYEQLKDKNLEIVSVSFDDNRAAWVNAVKEDKLPWLQVSDLKGTHAKDGLATRLDIQAIPQNLLINPEGIIIAANLKGEDLAAKIAALIK